MFYISFCRVSYPQVPFWGFGDNPHQHVFYSQLPTTIFWGVESLAQPAQLMFCQARSSNDSNILGPATPWHQKGQPMIGKRPNALAASILKPQPWQHRQNKTRPKSSFKRGKTQKHVIKTLEVTLNPQFI